MSAGSLWRPLSSRIRADHWRLWLALLLVMLPNLVWIVVDKTAWPWDQAWYGEHSVELFFTLIYSPSDWLPAMLGAFGRQAPGIAWAGQFFVPVGLLTGSIDLGLLLSIFLAQAVGVLLMYRALWELSHGRFWIAATGLIVMASAPLFIALGHYYLVEMMQTVAVAWFVLIMALAPNWNRLLTASQLGLATTFAMAAKVSSPLFCFGPGLVALYYLVRPGKTGDSDSRTQAAATLALGIPLGVATAAWYYQNFQAVAAHVSMASSGPIAELYGKSEQFFPSLKFWLSAVRANFFSTFTIFLTAGTIFAAIVAFLAKPRAPGKAFLLAAGVAAFQIGAGLCVFSLNSNRDDRYLLPLLPYFVLLLCWAVARLDRRVLGFALIAAFTLQWGHVHAQALGLIPRALGTPPWLNAAASDAGNRRILDSLVLRTCTERTSNAYSNTIGVQLLWLNPPAVSYAAAKRFAPDHTLNCDYEAIGYYEADAEEAWRRLLSRRTTYYVGVDSSTYQVPSTPVDRTVNQLTEPILNRVESSDLFQLESGIEEHRGILIFRRVERVDHVTNGRALSDRGKHQQAIDELNKATALEPANVEAWANLAVAYERQGNMEQAVSAGAQARRLNPNHYYVNLGLARAFFEQKKWKDAVKRAEDAASNAPGIPERVSALALAGRSSFQAGEPKKGCALLQRAGDLRSSREIADEMARRGCMR